MPRLYFSRVGALSVNGSIFDSGMFKQIHLDKHWPLNFHYVNWQWLMLIPIMLFTIDILKRKNLFVSFFQNSRYINYYYYFNYTITFHLIFNIYPNSEGFRIAFKELLVQIILLSM